MPSPCLAGKLEGPGVDCTLTRLRARLRELALSCQGFNCLHKLLHVEGKNAGKPVARVLCGFALHANQVNNWHDRN